MPKTKNYDVTYYRDSDFKKSQKSHKDIPLFHLTVAAIDEASAKSAAEKLGRVILDAAARGRGRQAAKSAAISFFTLELIRDVEAEQAIETEAPAEAKAAFDASFPDPVLPVAAEVKHASIPDRAHRPTKAPKVVLVRSSQAALDASLDISELFNHGLSDATSAEDVKTIVDELLPDPDAEVSGGPIFPSFDENTDVVTEAAEALPAVEVAVVATADADIEIREAQPTEEETIASYFVDQAAEAVDEQAEVVAEVVPTEEEIAKAEEEIAKAEEEIAKAEEEIAKAEIAKAESDSAAKKAYDLELLVYKIDRCIGGRRSRLKFLEYIEPLALRDGEEVNERIEDVADQVDDLADRIERRPLALGILGREFGEGSLVNLPEQNPAHQQETDSLFAQVRELTLRSENLDIRIESIAAEKFRLIDEIESLLGLRFDVTGVEFEDESDDAEDTSAEDAEEMDEPIVEETSMPDTTFNVVYGIKSACTFIAILFIANLLINDLSSSTGIRTLLVFALTGLITFFMWPNNKKA